MPPALPAAILPAAAEAGAADHGQLRFDAARGDPEGALHLGQVTSSPAGMGLLVFRLL